jgi:hypothetical protein
MRLNAYVWIKIAVRGAALWLPIPAVLLLLSRRAWKGAERWWWLWLAGGLVSVLVFFRLNYEHFYYQLPLVPALAAVAAHAMPVWPRRMLMRAAAAAALVVASALVVSRLYQQNPIYLDAGRALSTAAPMHEPVVVMGTQSASPHFPSVLYYADRTGWNLPALATSEAIQRLPGPSPCWLIVVQDGSTQFPLPDGWSTFGKTSEYVLATRTETPGASYGTCDPG